MVFFFFLVINGCSSSEHPYLIELNVSTHKTPELLKFSAYEQDHLVNTNTLSKGSSVFQFQVSDSAGNTELYALPEMYLQSSAKMNCIFTSKLHGALKLSLVEMNGSSGHFTLKNAKIIDTITLSL